MWRLIDKEGEVFRDGFDTQWDALITASKASGERYTKKEANALSSGAVIYRDCIENKLITSYELTVDGIPGDQFVRKVSVKTRNPFTLEFYD